MSRKPGAFRPDELDGPDADLSGGELAAASAAAREIQAAVPLDSPAPAREFAVRVMTAIAAEPTPRTGGFLAGLLRHPGLPSLVASVREAWAVGSTSAGRPAGTRGVALAYVLAIVVVGVSLTGAAAYGTAGALGLLGGDRSPTPAVIQPSASPEPSATLPEPSESAEPSSSADPGHSGEPTSTPGPSSIANRSGSSAAPSLSTNVGGSPTPSPSGSDDSGGSSSSPRPSDTPMPSATK